MPPPPLPHPRAALALLAFAQLIFSLDINIVYVALPDIGRSLGFDAHSLQWVVSAYTVFAGGFLLLGGRAADLLGRRRIFVAALLLYASSSLVGGCASAPIVLVGARIVQGLGGALLLPATLALIGHLFAEGAERNRALAVWGGAGASGLTLGALLGGVLTQAFGWPAVFFVNVALAGVAVLATFAVIPRDGTISRGRHFDLPGAAAVTVAATLSVFVLVQAPVAGWTSPMVLAALVVAVCAAAIFVIVESRSRDPLLPFRLLGNRNVVVGVGTTFVYMATFGALPYFLTVLLQDVHRFDAMQTGMAFLLPSVAIATGTQIGERVVNRLGHRTTLITGFALGIVGTAVLGLGFSDHTGYWGLVPGLAISGRGQGIVWTAMWIVASTGVAATEGGVANGLASTALNIGNAIGLAVLVAIAGALAPADAAGGGRIAVLVAAAVMILGIAAAAALRSEKIAPAVAQP